MRLPGHRPNNVLWELEKAYSVSAPLRDVEHVPPRYPDPQWIVQLCLGAGPTNARGAGNSRPGNSGNDSIPHRCGESVGYQPPGIHEYSRAA